MSTPSQHPVDLVRLNPASLPDASAFGHSQITIVEPSRLAFISGQVAWQPGGAAVPSDFGQQAELVVANAKSALAAAGATTADLVMVRIYVVDLTPERMQVLMPIVVNFLNGALPSMTGVGVAALAGPDLQLEIEMVARVK